MLPGLFLSAIKIMSKTTEIHINVKYPAIHNVQKCVLVYHSVFYFILLNTKWMAVEFILHTKGK